MTGLFDTRHVRRAFSRAAPGYDAVARLQHEVEARLLESLDYLDDPAVALVPRTVVDLGSGTGGAALAMRERWPQARILAIDLAMPMLGRLQERDRDWKRRLRRPLSPAIAVACADARALPLADGSVDLLFSNLCLQWVGDLPAVFAGFRRALRPGGRLLLSTFGPDTLRELRAAFAQADDAPHVSPFADIARVGDALVHSGFRDPVLDRDLFGQSHPDLPSLMRELRAIGATNALSTRRRTLTGRARFTAAARAYETMREAAGLPATWEVVYAQAWAPPAGAPIREDGFEVSSVPVSAIPIRRRR